MKVYTIEELRNNKGLMLALEEEEKENIYTIQEALLFRLGLECEVNDDSTLIVY